MKSKKLKICFIQRNAYSLFYNDSEYGFGGAEVRAFLFAKRLAKKPYFEVSFALQYHGQPKYEKKYGINLFVDGYNYPENVGKKSKYRLINYLKYKLKRLKKSISELKDFSIGDHRIVSSRFNNFNKVDADIYCTFINSEFAGELVAYAKRNNKKSILFLAHDRDVSEEYLEEGINSWGQKNSVGRYALKEADLIITQNKFQFEALQSRFKRSSVLIKNPVDFVSRLEPLNTKFDVLWVGRSNNVKRPDLLIKLAKHLPEISFLMIMNNSDDCLHNGITRNAPANVKLLEYVPYNQIEKYFASARVFVSTSKSEGFPNTFLQAGKYGLPIFSLTVNPDNFITEYDCGVFANDNYEVLLMEISEVFSDNKAYELKSTNCYSYFKDNHDLDRIVKEIELVISQLK